MRLAAHVAFSACVVAMQLGLAALNHRIGNPTTAGFCLGIAVSVAVDAVSDLLRIASEGRRLAELEARLRAGSGR